MNSRLPKPTVSPTQIIIVGGVCLLSFLFFPYTPNVLEYPKTLFLLVLALTALVVWSLESLLKKKVVVTRSPLDLPFFLLLLSFVLSTLFSIDRTRSLLIDFESWSWNLVILVSLAALYYLLVSTISNRVQARSIHNIWLMTGGLLALLSLLGFYYPASLAGIGGNWGSVLEQVRGNLTGHPKSLIILLLSLLPLVALRLIEAYKTSHWLRTLSLVKFFLLGVLIITASGCWFSLYIPGLASWSPGIIDLGPRESWVITSSALRDHPLLGSGPNTFILDFGFYKPASLNLTDYWQARFAQPFNQYFYVLSVMGFVGLGCLVTFIYRIVQTGLSRSSNGHSRPYRKAYLISVLVILAGWLFTTASFTTTLALFVVLALWMAREKVEESGVAESVVLSVSALSEKLLKNNGNQDNLLPASLLVLSRFLPWGLLIIALGLGAGGGWLIARDWRSSIKFTDSIKASSDPRVSGVQIYTWQQEAIGLNPYRDIYRRAYAQTNMALASAIIRQASSTSSGSPAGKELPAEQKDQVINLMQQSIREVRLITETLSPLSGANWEARALIYSSMLGGAQDAEQWTIDAYQQAIRLEPTNPWHYFNLGSLYYRYQSYDLAVDVFTTATRLKPDWANAHFNLAVALRDAGRLEQSDKEFAYAETLLGGTPAEADRQALDQERAKLAELFSEFSQEVKKEATSSAAPVEEITPIEVIGEGAGGQP